MLLWTIYDKILQKRFVTSLGGFVLIKHVIFDFDGTIADSMEMGLQIYNEFIDKYKYKKVTLEELRKLNELPIKERIKHVGIPLYKIPQISIDVLMKYKKIIHSLKPFDGIKDLIMDLKAKGLRLSIISSNSADNIQAFLKRNQLEVFDRVISEKNLFGKDKSIKKLLKQLNIDSDNVIYIGDELRDIDACQKLAIKIISVAWGFDSLELLKSGKPDFIAFRPKEIADIIEAI